MIYKNKEKWGRLLPIIKAFAKGEPIQIDASGDDKWEDVSDKAKLGFDLEVEQYRIKPEEWKIGDIVHITDTAMDNRCRVVMGETINHYVLSENFYGSSVSIENLTPAIFVDKQNRKRTPSSFAYKLVKW